MAFSNKATAFGGTNEYAIASSTDSLAFERTDKFSFSVWFRAGSDAGYFLSKRTTSTGYGVHFDGADDISAYIDGGGDLIQVDTPLSYGGDQWHNYVLTYDGSSQASGVKVYIDGTKIILGVTSDTLASSILNSEEFTLGALASGSSPFTGKLNEVSVWAEELTSAEVVEIWNSGVPADLSSHSAARYLRAWWRMGDGDTFPTLTDNSGGIPDVPDLSSSGYNGVAVNMGPTYFLHEAPYGKLINFELNEYVTMGNVLAFERTDAFSLAFWVKTSRTGATQYLVTKKAGASSYEGYGVALDSSGYTVFNLIGSDSSTLQIRYETSINDGQWHHVACTYDGSSAASGAAIYIDGELASTIVQTDTLAASIVNTESFNIATRTDVGNGDFTLVGDITQIGVYNDELTAGEVRAVYQAGFIGDLRELAGSSTDLVSYWTGAGKLHPTVKDLKGSNDGTMVTMEAGDLQDHIALSPVPASGYLTFDGTNEYVTMGDVLGDDTEYNTPFSVSAWVKVAAGSASNVVVSKRSSVGDNPGWFIQTSASTGLIYVIINVSTALRAYVQTSSAPGFIETGWHHVSFTYDGSTNASGITIYYDGAVQALTVNTDTLNGSIASSAPLNISGFDNGSALFNGEIDQVAIYDKELSSTEVTAIVDADRTGDLRDLATSGNLLGYWKLGEADSVNVVRDYSANLNDGTPTNMEAADIVKIYGRPLAYSQSCWDFTAAQLQYVDMGNVLAFERTDPFSLTFWFRRTTSTSSVFILSKISASAVGYQVILRGSGNGGVLRMSLIDGTHQIDVDIQSDYNDGKWHHGAVTYDGGSVASGVTWYVDGYAVAMTTVTNGTLSNTMVSTADFRIGTNDSGVNYCNADMTDVAVYDKELSASEVSEIFGIGVPQDLSTLSTASNLVGHWALDDNEQVDLTMTNMEAADFVEYPTTSISLSSDIVVPSYLVGLGISNSTQLSDSLKSLKRLRTLVVGHELDSDTFALWRMDETQYHGPDLNYEYSARATYSEYSTAFVDTNYVTMGNASELSFEYSDQFTISAWIKTTQQGRYFVSKNSGTLGYGCFVNNTSGTVRFSLLSASGNATISGSTDVSDGQWHHVVCVNAGTGTVAGMSIYVDGALETPTTNSDTLGASTIVNTAGFNISGRTDGAVSEFVGNIDSVAVFNTNLTSGNVTTLYNSGTPVDPNFVSPNLVGHWRMGDGDTYPTITDRSSSGNDGTMTNMASSDFEREVPGGYVLSPSTQSDWIYTPLVAYGPGGAKQTCRWFRGNPGTYESNLKRTSDESMRLLLLGDWTFECWVHVESLAQMAVFLYSATGSDIEANNALAYLIIESDGKLTIFWEYGAGVNASFTTASAYITERTWHHVAVTASVSGGTRTVKFYVDGAYKEQTSDTNASGGTSSEFWLGYSSTGSTFHGAIADVRLSSKERTSTEIAASAADYKHLLDSDTFALWRLDTPPEAGDAAGVYPLNPSSFTNEPAIVAPLLTDNGKAKSVSSTNSMWGPQRYDMRNFLNSGDQTFEFWFRIDGYSTSSSSFTPSNNFRALAFYASGETEGENTLLQIDIENDRTVQIFWEYGAGNNVTLTTDNPTFEVGDWWTSHHVAVTRSIGATTDVQVYVDGVLIQEWTGQTNVSGGTDVDMAFYIGDGTTDSYIIDDVRISSKIRTASEIANSYARGRPVDVIRRYRKRARDQGSEPAIVYVEWETTDPDGAFPGAAPGGGPLVEEVILDEFQV